MCSDFDFWKNWIPGVLSKEQVRKLINDGYLESEKAILDHSSIDLHLTDEGYEIKEGSIKPFGSHYFECLKHKGLLENKLTKNQENEFLLKRNNTYLFRIQEKLKYTNTLSQAKIYGQATAKSSIGRLDVLSRLIVDGAYAYEGFNPDDLNNSNGEMYIEITPITFDVKVKKGISLSQLRFFLGNPKQVEIHGPEIYEALLRDNNRKDGTLSVTLEATEIGGLMTIAFSAERREPSQPINLWEEKEEKKKPSPCDYWKCIPPNDQKRLKMKPDYFYILRSKEKLALTEGIAVYCRAIDETLGEMRIHYAGFAHPFFGRNREDGKIGTPLIFEVRAHNVNVNLLDGEKLAYLIFYRMSKDAKREQDTESNKHNEERNKKAKQENPEIKNLGKKEASNPYESQDLQLSKFFKKWPNKLKRNNEDFSVTEEKE